MVFVTDRHAWLWLRLRRSARAAWRRHRPSASIHFSCELSRQAVRPHFCFISLPCLASGTRGSCSCSRVSVMLPPSCPPWLHGRYSLHRYYGDSDSCPAPSSTKAGILDYLTCISRHSVSNHPIRPRLPAILLVPGGLGPRFALSRYRRFFGFRSVVAVSSVASGRIEFVSRAHDAPVSSTDYLFVSSCSPHPVAGLQLLSTRGGKHHHRGTFTLPCTLSLKRTTAPGPRAQRLDNTYGSHLLQTWRRLHTCCARGTGRGPVV